MTLFEKPRQSTEQKFLTNLFFASVDNNDEYGNKFINFVFKYFEGNKFHEIE